jgi:hypothetical protein
MSDKVNTSKLKKNKVRFVENLIKISNSKFVIEMSKELKTKKYIHI